MNMDESSLLLTCLTSNKTTCSWSGCSEKHTFLAISNHPSLSLLADVAGHTQTGCCHSVERGESCGNFELICPRYLCRNAHESLFLLKSHACFGILLQKWRPWSSRRRRRKKLPPLQQRPPTPPPSRSHPIMPLVSWPRPLPWVLLWCTLPVPPFLLPFLTPALLACKLVYRSNILSLLPVLFWGDPAWVMGH